MSDVRQALCRQHLCPSEILQSGGRSMSRRLQLHSLLRRRRLSRRQPPKQPATRPRRRAAVLPEPLPEPSESICRRGRGGCWPSGSTSRQPGESAAGPDNVTAGGSHAPRWRSLRQLLSSWCSQLPSAASWRPGRDAKSANNRCCGRTWLACRWERCERCMHPI